jgi:hypothetical protein
MFVDNVCRQVVARHLISGLVAALHPVCVERLIDDKFLSTASESEYLRAPYKELQALKKAFEESIRELED